MVSSLVCKIHKHSVHNSRDQKTETQPDSPSELQFKDATHTEFYTLVCVFMYTTRVV
jgi:hypothetical protein